MAGAARRLRLSASAFSRTLTRLREATGDPLLVRAGRRMVLTPCAEALRERTRAAVHEARALRRPCALEPDIARLQRTFTIRANGGFVEGFGAALIAASSAAAPLVRLRFTISTRARPICATAWPTSRSAWSAIWGRKCGSRPCSAITTSASSAPTTPWRRGQITAARYAAASHVVTSRRGQATGPVDTALAALGLERHIVAVVPGFPAALAIARASDLVALLPASHLTGQPEGCRIFALPVEVESLTISQMWHPRTDADPAHRWLRQLVLSICRARIPL